MKKLRIVISEGRDDFGAYCEKVPYIYGAGDTIENAKENVLEAIKNYKKYNTALPEILTGEYEIEFV